MAESKKPEIKPTVKQEKQAEAKPVEKKEETPKPAKPSTHTPRKEVKDTPPAVLGKDGDQIVITLNKQGNISDVKFTGTSYVLANTNRASNWLIQLKNFARLKRSKVNTAKLDAEMIKSKKKG